MIQAIFHFNTLKPGGNYVPDILTVCKAVFYSYGFCMVLTLKSDYFLK
jgi:hypothetical protein